MSQPPSDNDRPTPDLPENPAPGQAAQAAPGPAAAERQAWPPPQQPGSLPPAATAPPAYGPAPQPVQPRPFRRGFGLGAGAGLGFGVAALALMIVGGLLSAIALIAGAASSGVARGGAEGTETVWGEPTAGHTLRAIPVHGAIMADPSDGMGLSVGTYGYEVARTIDSLQEEDADGLVLLMNTPGGTINGSRAMADAVDRYRDRTGNQVFAYVQGMSASGGMYTMANADHIVADHGSLVGSVGVISGPFERIRDVTGTTGNLLESGVTTEGGIEYEYFTQGRYKDFGNPYRDMLPEEREAWNAYLASEYDIFVNWVAEHRDIPAQTIRDEYGALMFSGEAAVANGYIDAVAGQDEAFRDFATRAGVDPADTRVEQTVAPGPLQILLGAEARPLGVAPAAQPQGSEPARSTAALCTGTPQVLAVQGDLSAFCG